MDQEQLGTETWTQLQTKY